MSLETSKTEEVRQLRWLPFIVLSTAALFPLMGLLKGKLDEPVLWIFSVAVIALFAAVGFFSHRGYQRWATRRQGEFDALLDQFELLARDAAAVDTPPLDVEESAATTGALDLDTLDNAPDTASREGGRRSRS